MKKGMVPAAPFRQILAQYLEVEDTDRVQTAIAARAYGIPEKRQYEILNGIVDVISFDTADRIMCITERQMEWHSDPVLNEIYTSVDLSGPGTTIMRPKTRCARTGCSNTFVPRRGHAGKLQRFCSPRCYQAQYQADKFKRRGLKNRKHDKCGKGHDRSPENAYVDGRGTLQCRQCRREYMAAYRQRSKA